MNRFGRFLWKKCAALLLTALFVVNITLLSGCSGILGEDSEKSGEYVLENSSKSTAENMENGESTKKDEKTVNASEEATGSDAVKEEKDLKNAEITTAENETEASNDSSGSDDTKAVTAESEKTPGDKTDDKKINIPADAKPSESDPAWSDSFLLFLPAFKGGYTEGRVCEETFDHIVIGGVDSKRTIEDYIEEMKSAGFDVEADYVDHNGDIDFHAYNNEGWYAVVDYDVNDMRLDIGCGFFKEETEKGPESYFGTEILEVLPIPETGVLSGGKTDGDYPYALYEGCTLEDARAYAKKLKKADFDKDVLEGEADDQYWYNATGPGGYICDMQYADGIIMIGCDKAEV